MKNIAPALVVLLGLLTSCSDSPGASSSVVAAADVQADSSEDVVVPACISAADCDDANACTVDLCDKKSGCIHGPKDCDDGDACTTDTCDAINGCKNKVQPCDDGIECTTDKCDPVNGCKSVPADGACDDEKLCTEDKCDKTKGCTHTTKDCDDGNPCTEDVCDKVKECVSTPVQCDDGIECTTDKCDPTTGCKYVPADAACDDGKVCTVDKCDKTKDCTHMAKDCDDGNACTEDVCDKVEECTSTPVQCDDGDACTSDKCDKASGCVFTKVACDDGNACTEDVCDKVKECVSTPVQCNDGDACTDDKCDKGSGCVFTKVACDDGDTCTQDVCDKTKGCQSAPLDCNDDDACTNDKCDKTKGCVHTKSVCDDGIECTTDTCDPTSGCKTVVNFGAKCGTGGTCDAAAKCGVCVPKCDSGSCTDGCGGFCPGSCNDGNACTVDDACNSGKCQGSPKECSDGNACTKDSCDQAAGCKNVNDDTAQCNDGNACTGGEKCSGGSCSGTKLTCDDQNECTIDSCDPKEGCKNVAKPSGTCASDAGKCIDGGCCVPKCGANLCGDNGCGGSCGTCGPTSACTGGKCEKLATPIIESITPERLFPVGGDAVLPGYVAHLLGTKVFGTMWYFASVSVKNPTTSFASVVLKVQLLGFSQASETQIGLAAGESKTVDVNLTLDTNAIYALKTQQTTKFVATLSEAGQMVATAEFPVKLAMKNTVFWSISENGQDVPMHPLVATMVTPKNLDVQKLLTSAGAFSVFKVMSGYQMLQAKTKFSYVVSPNQCLAAPVVHQAGDEVSIEAAVTGGVSNNSQYYLLDYYTYLTSPSWNLSAPVSSVSMGTMNKKVGVQDTGWYVHVMCNPSSNFSNRTFTVTRTMGANEVTVDQIGAIFNAIKSKGLIYTSVTTDYFKAAQNVKTPGESLATNSANCADGTLLFASALEALGMEAKVVILADHVYVAVGDYPGALLKDGHWTALETTMVGSSSAVAAIAEGAKKLMDNDANGAFEAIVDIKAARAAGIVPGGF